MPFLRLAVRCVTVRQPRSSHERPTGTRAGMKIAPRSCRRGLRTVAARTSLLYTGLSMTWRRRRGLRSRCSEGPSSRRTAALLGAPSSTPAAYDEKEKATQEGGDGSKKRLVEGMGSAEKTPSSVGTPPARAKKAIARLPQQRNNENCGDVVVVGASQDRKMCRFENVTRRSTRVVVQ